MYVGYVSTIRSNKIVSAKIISLVSFPFGLVFWTCVGLLSYSGCNNLNFVLRFSNCFTFYEVNSKEPADATV